MARKMTRLALVVAVATLVLVLNLRLADGDADVDGDSSDLLLPAVGSNDGDDGDGGDDGDLVKREKRGLHRRNRNRKGRLFSIFQIVSFPNDPCPASLNRNGTCYTMAECASRGGTDGGSCASGFGVCCVFVVGCGVVSAENCTYFEVDGATSGECTFTACPCGDNICQLRLDFNSFSIAGPSTVTSSQFKVLNGVIARSSNARPANVNTQCLVDTFGVTSPGNQSPPVICGSNAGDHMYVESSTSCNDLSFQLGSASTTATRSWSIKVTQYSCAYDNLAPEGCTQYFFGANTDVVQTYNWDGSHHIASQNQVICVRQERGNCRICWTQVNAGTDFQVSDRTDRSRVNVSPVQCCNYGTNGQNRQGYDCVQIPGAVKTTGIATPSRICGRNVGLGTDDTSVAAMAMKTVCSNMQPFLLRFASDSFEFAGNNREANNNDAGFQLAFIMDSAICP